MEEPWKASHRALTESGCSAVSHSRPAGRLDEFSALLGLVARTFSTAPWFSFFGVPSTALPSPSTSTTTALALAAAASIAGGSMLVHEVSRFIAPGRDAREVTPELRYPTAHHPVRKMEPHLAAQLMQTMEKDIASLIDHCGTMERIKATRLPIAYVSHLRTILMGFVLCLPFVYEGYWGWGTIPAVAAPSMPRSANAMAATECENPFSPKRTNHLGMDGFCEATQREVMELLQWWRKEEGEE